MKQTFYLLKNKSSSEGTYLFKGEYKSLFPGDEIHLEQKPTNMTSNITLLVYKKEIGETIQYLKPKTVKVEKSVKKNSR